MINSLSFLSHMPLTCSIFDSKRFYPPENNIVIITALLFSRNLPDNLNQIFGLSLCPVVGRLVLASTHGYNYSQPLTLISPYSAIRPTRHWATGDAAFECWAMMHEAMWVADVNRGIGNYDDYCWRGKLHKSAINIDQACNWEDVDRRHSYQNVPMGQSW